MPRDHDKAVQASKQIRDELHAVIRRYGQECDITVYQAIGVLEIVKADLIDLLPSEFEPPRRVD